jgi:hypothetical protein
MNEDGSFTLATADGTPKQELERGAVWDEDTDTATREKYGESLYPYEAAFNAWISGDTIWYTERNAYYPEYESYSYFFPVAENNRTYFLLEVVPDSDRLIFDMESRARGRFIFILVAIIFTALIALLVVEHLVNGRWFDPDTGDRERWVPSWLRIVGYDIYARFLIVLPTVKSTAVMHEDVKAKKVTMSPVNPRESCWWILKTRNAMSFGMTLLCRYIPAIRPLLFEIEGPA